MTAVFNGPRSLPNSRRAGLPLTEKQWQTQVEALAKLCGWRYHHAHDSRRSVAGLPDLLLIRPPRVVFIELKTNGGRVSVDQQLWLDDLKACPGVEAYVIRPDDLEQLRRILARRHKP